MSSLKIRRVVMGLRQLDVANKIGCSPSHYCLIERGDLQAKPEMLEKIGKVLNATPDELKRSKKLLDFKDTEGKEPV